MSQFDPKTSRPEPVTELQVPPSIFTGDSITTRDFSINGDTINIATYDFTPPPGATISTEKVVIIPGRAESVFVYTELIEALLASGKSVKVIEPYGQGKSHPNLHVENPSYPDTHHVLNGDYLTVPVRDILREVFEYTKDGSVSVIAQSTGCALALQALRELRHEGVVDLTKAMLTLLSPLLEFPGPLSTSIITLISNILTLGFVPDTPLGKFSPLPQTDPEHQFEAISDTVKGRALLQRYEEYENHPQGPPAFSWLACVGRIMVRNLLYLPETLKNIPTRVYFTESDKIVGVSIIRNLLSQCPSVDLKVWKGGHQLLMSSQATELIEELTAHPPQT